MRHIDHDTKPTPESLTPPSVERRPDSASATAYERDDLSPGELREWNARQARRILRAPNGEDLND